MSAPDVAVIRVEKFRVDVTFEVAGQRHGIGFDLDDCSLNEAVAQFRKVLLAVEATLDSEEVAP